MNFTGATCALVTHVETSMLKGCLHHQVCRAIWKSILSQILFWEKKNCIFGRLVPIAHGARVFKNFRCSIINITLFYHIYGQFYTCPIYMNWVGSSIAVDYPTHRLSGREVWKGSKLYCRKSNSSGKLQIFRRIVSIRSGRDDPSVEKSTWLLKESGRKRKIKTSMNTGRLCCAKKLRS